MKRINRTQRLARREEGAVVKRIFWLSVISIVLIAVIFTIGIPLLGKFADLLDKVFKKNTVESSENVTLQPPTLDTLPTSTNQDTITVSGFANNSLKVEVYNNGEKADEATVDSGRFELKDFKLASGDNRISAKSVGADSKSTSDFSQEVTVVLDKKPPDLEVANPSDGQTFVQNNRIKVDGKSEKDAQVFANGFLANVDADGNFEVTIPLVEGENKIEVKALDDAGNTTTREIKVNFRK